MSAGLGRVRICLPPLPAAFGSATAAGLLSAPVANGAWGRADLGSR